MLFLSSQNLHSQDTTRANVSDTLTMLSTDLAEVFASMNNGYCDANRQDYHAQLHVPLIQKGD